MRIKIVYKLLVPIIVLMIFSSVVLFVYIASRTRANTIESTTQAAVATIDQFKILRGYYTQAVVSKVKAHTDLSISFDHDTDATTIPLPATMIHDLSERFSQVGRTPFASSSTANTHSPTEQTEFLTNSNRLRLKSSR